MKCDHARRLAEFARPGVTELDAADVAGLEAHLADCPDCAAFVRQERRTEERLASFLRRVEIPGGAVERLKHRLDRERWRWYRRRLTPAAALVLAALVAWLARPAPRLDYAAVAEELLARVGRRAAADDWLRGIDRRFGFPPKFRSKYLVRYELQAYHGTTAPVLQFVRKGTLARVAVVRESQFRNLSTTPDGIVAWNSAAAVQLMRDDSFPGVVFVIELINGPVEPFFVEDDPPVM